jgi:enamine deaminase RidA (YjgF/YER057c/UK114 family)
MERVTVATKTTSTRLDIPRIVHSSPAVPAGQLMFASGLIGVSPLTGRLVSKFTELDDEGKTFATGMLSVDGWIEGIGAQFWQTCKNLQAVLEDGGSSLGQLVLLNFFTRQMHHHHLINSLRTKIFQPTTPAPNTGMQVAANPANALMQASAIGFLPTGSQWQRRIIKESAVPQAVSHYDLGVQVGPFLFTGDFVPGSQKLQRAVERYDDVPTLPKSLHPYGLVRRSYEEPVRAQAWFLYENIRDVLAENGASLEDIVKLRVYLVDIADAASFADVHEAVFGSHAPVVTLATAEKLGRPEFRVAIEVVAVVPRLVSDARFKPRFISVASSEQFLSTSSPGVVVGPYVFLGNCTAVSRQGIWPIKGNKVVLEGSPPDIGSLGADFMSGPVVAETWLALQHGAHLLRSAGASLDDVVALNVYLLSVHDLSSIDQVLRHVFPANPPAVTIIQVPALPVLGSRVDIEITAYVDRGRSG